MSESYKNSNISSLNTEYTGKIDFIHKNVEVNAFPPFGEKHILFVTGGHYNFNYFIETNQDRKTTVVAECNKFSLRM